MRYKIEKIAKRNNLDYSVVNFDGGFKGFDCGIDDVAIGSGTLKGFVFLREDLLEE